METLEAYDSENQTEISGEAQLALLNQYAQWIEDYLNEKAEK